MLFIKDYKSCHVQLTIYMTVYQLPTRRKVKKHVYLNFFLIYIIRKRH